MTDDMIELRKYYVKQMEKNPEKLIDTMIEFTEMLKENEDLNIWSNSQMEEWYEERLQEYKEEGRTDKPTIAKVTCRHSGEDYI
jgi:hypothetical protein